MNTKSGSAQAYSTLAAWTREYTQVKEVYDAWTTALHAVHAVRIRLSEVNASDGKTLSALSDFEELATTKRVRLWAWLEDKQREMNALNSRIQEGTYNNV